MPDTLLYTREAAYAVLEDSIEERDMDWDRRLTVVQGWSAATEVSAVRAQFARKPWLGFWPETVRARRGRGGMIRVEIESAGLAAGEKFYEMTEDNGELQVYQLTGGGAGVRIHGVTGWKVAGTNSSELFKQVNVEIGVPRYGIVGWSHQVPDARKNGNTVAAPIRGLFPNMLLHTPPWRYVPAVGELPSANFPGGWRQVAAPYKLLGGLLTSVQGANFKFVSGSGPYCAGQWHYAFVDKKTI